MFFKRNEDGTLTLETCLALTFSVFFFLAIYGIFGVISAQNRMTHALVQASKSLSMDSYITESVNSAAEDGTLFWGDLGDIWIEFSRSDYSTGFSSKSDWYETNDVSVVKKRFQAYLCGDDGTSGSESADDVLKNMKIVDGLNGVTFDLVVGESSDEMTITMKYKIQYWCDAFNFGKIPMEQKITSHLWKPKS